MTPRTEAGGPARALWAALTSLRLTITCLVLLMVLVIACTLAQVELGTWGAVEVTMRAWWVRWTLPGTQLAVPVLPGGATVGVVLLANLIAAQVSRLELSWKKSGLWLTHLGLVILVVGEFVTGLAQRESRIAVVEGQTANYAESMRDMEVAVVDVTDATVDDVYSIPATTVARQAEIAIPDTPVVVKVHGYHVNADLSMRKGNMPKGPATAGLGPTIAVVARDAVSRDDEMNRSVAWVEPVVDGQSQGIFLVSNAIEQAQTFEAGGRRYELSMRQAREYLPYALTLVDFRHDVYPGTAIPKNFSSLVRLQNPARNESREVLISMNQPLRYEGKAFYQSSFGRNDTLSILQVVENPGWLMPYVATLLVTLGLLVHFAIIYRRSASRRERKAASAAAPTTAPVAIESHPREA